MSGRYLLDTSILIALFADEMAVNLYSLIRSPFVDGPPSTGWKAHAATIYLTKNA